MTLGSLAIAVAAAFWALSSASFQIVPADAVGLSAGTTSKGWIQQRNVSHKKENAYCLQIATNPDAKP
jgi:hypothetical protein